MRERSPLKVVICVNEERGDVKPVSRAENGL